MILLAGKVTSAKECHGPSGKGRTEVPEAKKLASGRSQLVFSGQEEVAHSREVYGRRPPKIWKQLRSMSQGYTHASSGLTQSSSQV